MSNRENNNNPMELSYFDDVLGIFYDNLKENENLYKEIHDSYNNNRPTGFSLGTSRTGIEMTKTLATIRATAIQGASALFNAKKSIVEIELKKKAQIVDETKANNDKEFIRTALSEINNPKYAVRRYFNDDKEKSLSSSVIEEKIIAKAGRKELDDMIADKVNSGEIIFTNNEKAMKYDFNKEVEVVLNANDKKLIAVKKGTTTIVEDYPIERANIDSIMREDLAEGKAYSENGKVVRIVAI